MGLPVFGTLEALPNKSNLLLIQDMTSFWVHVLVGFSSWFILSCGRGENLMTQSLHD